MTVAMLDYGARPVIYLLLWLCPAHRCFRRPAMRTFARTQVMYQVLGFTLSLVLYFALESNDALICGAWGLSFTYSIMVPFLMFHTFLMDGYAIKRHRLCCVYSSLMFLISPEYSNYWRGLLDDAETQSFEDPTASHTVSKGVTPLSAPLLGISLTESAAASVAEQLDGGIVKAPSTIDHNIHVVPTLYLYHPL